MRKKFRVEVLTSILIWVCLLTYIKEDLSNFFLQCASFVGIMLLIQCIINFKIKITIFFLYVCGITLGLLNYVIVGQCTVGMLTKIFIIFFPIALTLANMDYFHTKFWVCNCVLLYIYIMYEFVIVNNYRYLFYQTSRNFVSVYLLIDLFVLAIVLDRIEKKIPLWVVGIFFSSCVLAVGRGGILSAMIYAFLRFICQDKPKNKKQLTLKIFYSTLLFIGFFIFLKYYDYVMDTFFNRFETRSLISEPREEMLRIYFNKLNGENAFISIIFGIKTILLNLPFRYGGNFHNSYIMTHAAFGILGIICLTICMINITMILMKKKKIDLAAILIAFIFRCGTDYVFPETIGCIVPLWCIIIYFEKNLTRKTYIRVTNEIK